MTVPTKRIVNKRSAPALALTYLPEGIKPSFTGLFKLETMGPDIWLFISHRHHLVMADVVEVSGTGPNDCRLLTSFRVPYVWRGQVPAMFSAQLLWLDPEKRRQPILKLDCFNEGEYGPIGDNVLAVFPQGLKGTPVVQGFDYGSWRASDTCGKTNTFNTTDANGLLQVSS